MSEIKTNRELAQEISARIGNAPIPFDSVYSICLEIYNELGGEPAEFDSVYSILLETLPLAESIAKKTSITEVDELPDAQDNNNIYRLSSDDNVYMSKHVSTDYTNRLPDDEQIDKAYIYNDEDIYYYKGTWKIILNDGEVDGYGWLMNYNNDNDWYLYVTQEDAEHATGTTKMFYFYQEAVDGVDFENHTVTYDDSIETYQWEDADTINGDGGNVIPAIYNAPEADCIGNAYLVDTVMSTTWIYDGTEVQYEDDETGEQCVGYKWVSKTPTNFKYVVTSKKASEIYYFKGSGWAHSDTIIHIVSTSDVGIWADYEDLYIPQLNAPDSEQIGKAYILAFDNAPGAESYYTGTAYTLVDGDGVKSYIGYAFEIESEEVSLNSVFTLKPANEIYNANADDIEVYYTSYSEYKLLPNNTIKLVEEEAEWDKTTLSDRFAGSGNTCSIVKYQRAIENWEWQENATKNYVNLAINNIPQYAAGQNININNSSINTRIISALGYTYNSSKKSFAEGYGTTASGDNSHAEGYLTLAKQIAAHAEGKGCIAEGMYAHAEGADTRASVLGAHAEGSDTKAQNHSEHAEGRWNVSHKSSDTYGNSGNTLHSVGIGTGENSKKNAFEVMQNGDTYVFGIGGYQGTDTKVQNASIMTVQDYVSARETYVDTNFAKVVSLTQVQYDALTTKDAHTLYIITDAQ